MAVTLLHGDCLDVLRGLPDASVDSVVTDPPYGLSFMGKRWDYDVPPISVWAECLRVLKPGGHLLAFAGTRTQHRMAVRIEDAGFEIRDMIAWVYGSGFPKSLDVSKAIDKAAGHERETDYKPNHKNCIFKNGMGGGKHGAQSEPPATDSARQWAGWGTALKPALEPITVARKPLVGTVAENVLRHGTGAINVDGCRVDGKRWPANLNHDGSDDVVGLLPSVNSRKPYNGPRGRRPRGMGEIGERKGDPSPNGPTYGDTGSAARFFYCAKASRADRDDGCDALPHRSAAETVERDAESAGMDSPRAGAGRTSGARNHHPTVKPTDLMRYLVRLVTPPGGVVLDPFMGSGSTGRATVLEAMQFIGIERELAYLEIAQARITAATQKRGLF